MKKPLIFVGLLAIGFANAQEGNVGINTSLPKATLDIQPNADNAKADATSNQGIIIPKLTKSRVAAIASANLVEGTKVYVTDEVTTADTQFIGTGKGFYFYNGAKWVKQLASDTDTNSELWAQRDNTGVTETYLKPANGNGDFIGYRNDRKWSINLGNISERELDWDNGYKGFVSSEIPISTLTSSDVLPLTSTIGGGSFYYFSNDSYIVKDAHASQNPDKTYIGKEHYINAAGLTSDTNRIMGLNSSANFNSNSNIRTVIGIRGITGIGGSNNPNATVTYNTAGEFLSRNSANSANMMGVDVQANNAGNVTQSIIGGRFRVYSSNGTTVNNFSDLQGIRVAVENKANSTVKAVRGSYIITDYQESSVATDGYGLDVATYVKKSSKIDELYNVNSYIRGNYGEATVKNVYGFRFGHSLNNDFKPTNMYGLHIADIDKATTNNFAIHTGKGKVRVGDLADTGATTDRVVTVDANGVLKTGGSIAANNGVQTQATMECNEDNRGKMNFGRISINSKETDAIGFCMKNGDNQFRWYYIYGGASHTVGTNANFGQGL